MFNRCYLLLFAGLGLNWVILGSDFAKKNQDIQKITFCDNCYDDGQKIIRQLEQKLAGQRKEMQRIKNERTCEGLLAGFVVGIALISIFSK